MVNIVNKSSLNLNLRMHRDTSYEMGALHGITVLCPCGETQTMSHIVESCPLTKLNGGLSRLHSADEDAVSWLTNYGK